MLINIFVEKSFKLIKMNQEFLESYILIINYINEIEFIKKRDKIGFLFLEKFPMLISTIYGGFISFFGALLLFFTEAEKK